MKKNILLIILLTLAFDLYSEALTSYQGVMLFSPLPAVTKQFDIMEKSKDSSLDIPGQVTYVAKNYNNPQEWTLFFEKVPSRDPVLISLSVKNHKASYEDYLTLVNANIKHNSIPNNINEPDILPWYSANWITELEGYSGFVTVFSITYTPDIQLLVVSLRFSDRRF